MRFHLDQQDEEGQAMVEYALILALIAVASLTALTVLSANIQAQLDAIAARLTDIVAGL
jgi:Flp pilus assembly pilin Flp